MSEIALKAKERKISRKSVITQLRKSGNVPGVFYHKKEESIPIEVSESSLKPFVYTSETHIIALSIENKLEMPCILKNVQFDPVSEKIIHFDLQGISRDEKLEIEVPVVLVGNPVGIKQGGIIQQSLHKLHVECLPADIPEHIEVNITSLNIGDAVHVSSIQLEKLKILNSADAVIVSVVTPKIEKEVTPAVEGGEESKEPEVISKGKVEKEED